MALFEPPKRREEHVIRDNGLSFPCDYSYAKKGMEEGWLGYVSGYTDYRFVHVHTYVYLGKDIE
jgi:hypothetical protein